MAFWRRNLACASLSIRQQLEYRFNFLMDVAVQPLFTAATEVAVWIAIFASLGSSQLAGMGRESYLAYVFWGAFFARHSATWEYDFKLVDEIQTGSINSVLTRPTTYYEYYLFQFLGKKVVALGFSLLVPIGFSLAFSGPVMLNRLPLALFMSLFYLIFVYSLSFLVASLGFFMTRVSSIFIGKNIALWLMSGEIFPLDLLPESIRATVCTLPFASGVYLPVGYLTGRIDLQVLGVGFQNLLLGILCLQLLCYLVWRAGMRRYSGVGA